MLCYGLKVSEYKVYWLTGFPQINRWVHAEKSKQASIREKIVMLQSIGIIVINKGGHLHLQIFKWEFNPYNSVIL